MAALVSFHWLIPPSVNATGKIPTPKPIGAKYAVHHPSRSNLLVYSGSHVGVPVSDSPCHESPTRHYRFGRGPLTRSDSCERVRGCQRKRLDGKRVRYSLCIRRTAYGVCTEYIRVVRSTLTQYNMETSPPTMWLVGPPLPRTLSTE